MKNNPLPYLFYTNFVILFVGFGLFPLLPVYALEIGATPGEVGVYLAIIYVAIALGSMLPGWLPAHISRKRLFIAGGLTGVPGLFLLGFASTLWQVAALTALVWFSGGVGLSLSSVFTGVTSDRGRSGRSFSLLALSMPAGSLIGGLAVGALVAWSGYRAMFIVVALLYATQPLVVYLKLADPKVAARNDRSAPESGPPSQTDHRFALLLLTVLFAGATVYVGRMGLSLSMKTLSFSPAAITSTSAVAGVVAVPFILLMGVLADRLGRGRFLAIGYLLTGAGALALIVSAALWQFWMAGTLLLVGRAVNDSMASAVATDVLSPGALARGLPWVRGVNSVAGILSFAGAGYLMEALNVGTVYFSLGLLAVAAAALVKLVSREVVAEKPAPVFSRQPCSP